MKCDQVKLELPGYMFDELTAAEKKMIEEHLKDCRACRAELADLRQAREIIQSVPLRPVMPVPAPTAKLSSGKHSHPIWMWTAKWAIAAAIVGFALMLVRPNVSLSREGFAFNTGMRTADQPLLTESVQDALDQNRLETLMMVSQILAQNSVEQRRETMLTMAALSKDLGQQRRNDLEWIETGLNEVQRSSRESMLRTNMILDDLIKNTHFQTGGETND